MDIVKGATGRLETEPSDKAEENKLLCGPQKYNIQKEREK